MTEGQVAAFAMAVLLRGMAVAERVALTLAMRESGEVLDWSGLDGPVIDKHSTGGIGDNVSLVLAPALTACGAFVPMISGRGLGHTGGTLDKLDAIPGYRSQPDAATFRRVTREVGCAVIGQTDEIAPADKKLYAIRDVTATVESVDLITASILSKKLAAGLDALVLDVKCGSGAFMATPEDACGLAESLVRVANGAGCRTAALLTDMNQPLASAAGNAVEVANAVAFLTGDRIDPRLWTVSLALGGELLTLGGLSATAEAGEKRIADAFTSGRAAEVFGRMVAGLGGPVYFLQRHAHHLPAAPVVREAIPAVPGRVQRIDTRAIGLAVIELGGGRRRASDPIDHAVGFTDLAAIGARVDAHAPLGRVHARSAAAAEAAAATLRAAYAIGPEAPTEAAVILGRIA